MLLGSIITPIGISVIYFIVLLLAVVPFTQCQACLLEASTLRTRLGGQFTRSSMSLRSGCSKVMPQRARLSSALLPMTPGRIWKDRNSCLESWRCAGPVPCFFSSSSLTLYGYSTVELYDLFFRIICLDYGSLIRRYFSRVNCVLSVLGLTK